MIWVVDTCVLIDVIKSDPQFGRMSVRALQAKLDDTLVIAPITYIEHLQSGKGGHLKGETISID